MKTLTATCQAWSIALGVDHKTLLKRWLRAGHPKPKRGQQLAAREVFEAFTGDLAAARARQATAEAEWAELRSQKARNEVIPTDDVRTFIATTFSPIRADALNLPALYAAKCNPENPELARAALLEFADTFIARRRENLPHFKIED